MVITFFYNISLVLSIFLVLSFSSWFFIWASIELITAMLVILISRNLGPRSVEGLSKYFIAQAMASAFILIGIVYRFFTTNNFSILNDYDSLSFSLILLGLLIKIAAVPNPYWFVDSISGLSLTESFYIIIMSKIVPMYLYIIIAGELFSSFLLWVGISSVAVGSLLIINQTNIRKILALSSISHLGWLLLGLPCLGYQLSVLIFVIYLLMVAPLLWVNSFYNINDLFNTKRSFINPLVFFLVILSLLSLGGFPPLIGFFYKWVIFLGLLENKSYLVCGFLIIMSLISLFAYLRLCYYLYSLYNFELKYSSDSNLMITNSLSWWTPYIITLCVTILSGGFVLLSPIF
uniref:NADH-ubiquinone oxidoreductase chain 2 n=1 Tax=Amphipholis squamata TaxID=48271 RepID=D3H5V0_AMPSQ|nr:NADH dehydrogenase subunit 2 [Amphipholis squamata]